MGKMGQLIRETKKNSVTYTFTREELEKRDAHIRMDWEKKNKEAYLKKLYREYRHGEITDTIALTIAIPCWVLKNKFGWEECDGENELSQFVNHCLEKFNESEAVSSADIQDFCVSMLADCNIQLNSEDA